MSDHDVIIIGAGFGGMGAAISLKRLGYEDIAICEAVQTGLRSRTYDHGRYSALRENGLHHFHGLLTRALA